MSNTYVEPLGDVWRYDPDYNAVADFLGVDKYKRESLDLASKISYIIDWAGSKNKSTKVQDSLWTLNDLKKKLGINTQGETLIGQLFEFIRLKQDREQKSPQIPYKETMNQMIDEHRQKQMKHEELSFKAVNQHIKQKVKLEQEDTKKGIQNIVNKYKSSFKPEPETKVKTIQPVDHTPQPV